MLKRVILIIFVLCSFCACAQTCKDIQITGEIKSARRVKGKVERTTSYYPLPDEITMHTGSFHKIKFSKEVKNPVFTIYKNKQVMGTRTGPIKSLTEFIDSFEDKKPTHLIIEYNKCKKYIKLRMSDI